MAGALKDDAMSRRIVNINRLLVSFHHEVHLIQYVRKSVWQSTAGNGVDLSAFDHSIAFSPRGFVNLRHLLELDKDNYDLVYGNTYGGAFWSVLGKMKKLPLIYDMHGSLVEEYRLNATSHLNPKTVTNLLAKKVVEGTAIRFSDRIMCVSRKMMLYLNRERGVPLKKTHYVTNGVDLAFFKNAPDSEVQILKKSLGIDDKLVFGYIGETQKWQGAESFIDAAKKIADQKSIFLVVGGKNKDIQRSGNLIFVPRISHMQIPLYSSICDVLVLPRPSHLATEIAAPTKFAEYTAMSKPILSTNVGDAAELVNMYNCGVVVENNSERNLLSGIQKFSETPSDILKEWGKNSRKLAEEEFDWDKIKWKLNEAIDL